MDGDAGFHKRVSLKSIRQRTVVAWVRPWFLDNHYGALRAHELSIDAPRTQSSRCDCAARDANTHLYFFSIRHEYLTNTHSLTSLAMLRIIHQHERQQATADFFTVLA